MRKSLLFLVLAAAAASATPATAAYELPVQTGTGGCRTNYNSVANVNDTHVCVRNVTLNPDVYVSQSGCAAGYTEVGSAAARRWVCVGL